jgi:phage gpG-like protein
MADEGIQGLNRLLGRIAEMATDTRHVERPLRVAGEIAVRSIGKNFDAQGRPKHWTPLRPSTIAARRRGKGKGGIKMLQSSGNLRGSIHATPPSAEGVRIGTKVIYAARQHFGYGNSRVGAFSGAKTGGSGRGHSPTPSRLFLMLQEPEDIVEIGNVFRRHIAKR